MNYDVTQVHIDNCSSESDLGIIFDSKLLFDTNIDKAVKNANQTLGIIKRTVTFLNKSVLISLYKALVGPHLEYGNEICYPRLKRQSTAVEKVQRRATKLVKEICHFHYEDQLRYLDLSIVKMRRIWDYLIQTYKLFLKTVDLQSSNFVRYCDHNKTRYKAHKIFIQYCKIKLRKIV